LFFGGLRNAHRSDWFGVSYRLIFGYLRLLRGVDDLLRLLFGKFVEELDVNRVVIFAFLLSRPFDA
jgi:hypothetical protein